MNNWWLMFGCFLTGYKYEVIRHCSVASAKAVMKYTSAIMLVSLVWGFVGFYFPQRYLHAGLSGCISGAVLLVFVIVQVERQIMLTFGKNLKIIWFRIALAIVMAFIGSIIIDQVIFADDIKAGKEEMLSDKVNAELPKRTAQLNALVRTIDSAIRVNEGKRDSTVNAVVAKPTFPKVNVTTTYKIDSAGTRQIAGQNVEQTTMANPKAALIPAMDTLIASLYVQRAETEHGKLEAENTVREEIRKRQGFFDELKTLFNLIFSSVGLVFVWVLFFSFFFSIELLVVFAKKWDDHNDYEYLIRHQMNIRIDQLKVLRDE